MTVKVIDREPTVRSVDTRYTPYGGAYDLMYAREKECLIAGSAGTGKSVACLHKLLWVAEKYPGARILICRKTRESMTETTLASFEQKVLPPDSKLLLGASRRTRQSYQFSNGSEIIIGGLKQSNRDATQKIMSSDYDVIYVPEAIELEEVDWGRLVSRLRNHKVPYQQLIGDTNPSHPRHWLKLRCDQGQCRYIYSKHEDNPMFYDRDKKEWTKNGKDYLDGLRSLTGNLRLRLYEGRWVQSEGVIYENWNASLHVIDPFDIPRYWKRYMGIDFGYQNPFTCLWLARSPEDRLYVYRQLIVTQHTVEDICPGILHFMGQDPEVVDIICDHDAEDRATLEKHLKRPTTAARKDIKRGIQAMMNRLKKDYKGTPRLFVFRDSVLHNDPIMVARREPIGLASEMDAYVWKSNNTLGPREEPEDRYNHCADPVRYLIQYFETGQEFEAPPRIELPKPFDWTQPQKLSMMPQRGMSVPGMFGINIKANGGF